MFVPQIPELGDTVFVVLRKKPLIFLHWYHHVTVLLYCWHSYYEQTTYGLYFICMNYTVHGEKTTSCLSYDMQVTPFFTLQV